MTPFLVLLFHFHPSTAALSEVQQRRFSELGETFDGRVGLGCDVTCVSHAWKARQPGSNGVDPALRED